MCHRLIGDVCHGSSLMVLALDAALGVLACLGLLGKYFALSVFLNERFAAREGRSSLPVGRLHEDYSNRPQADPCPLGLELCGRGRAG